MTNTTKNTTKSIFLALSVAFTMGTASAAVQFTGTTSGGTVESNLPSSFEFSMPSVTQVATGNGLTALTQINSILDNTSSGTQGGTNINKDLFWSAFVSDQKVQIFRFDHAETFIEELIFTVTGEAYGTKYVDDGTGTNVAVVGYHDASDIATGPAGNTSDMRTDLMNKTSNATNGTTYLDGKLKATGEAAVALLAKLGFNNLTGTLGAYSGTEGNVDGNVTATLNLVENPITVMVAPTDSDGIAALIVTESSTILDKINAANIDQPAFANANDLIGKIAAQLKSGYILDVGKAAEAVNSVISQHNNFLGASMVAQAKLLKPIIKNIGLQIAAVELGKTIKTGTVCDAGSGSDSCVEVGLKFVDISQQITTLGADASTYQAALDAVEVLANNIIEFNGTASGFESGSTTTYDANGNVVTQGSGAAGDIEAQFGTITVVEGTTLYNQLVADEADGTFTAPDLEDAFGTTIGDIDTLFDSTVVIDGETVELF